VNEHSATLHQAATGHLPFFISAPGEGDGLFNAMIVFLVVVVFSVGLLYLRLHALPERLAHGASKMQIQLVGVLALLALFTHNHIFWIGALLIALVQFPNVSAPLASMAQSLEKLAGDAPPQRDAQVAPDPAQPVMAVPTRRPPPAETERAPAVPERVA
jgi:multisubunit Na+/H+ antiporter MnhF subunit